MSSRLLNGIEASLPVNQSAVSLPDFATIADVELTISAELARRTLSVRDVIKLQQNDLLILPRSTGENVDVFAGDILIGAAEILASDENFAIRIADLLDRPSNPAASTIQTFRPGTNESAKAGLPGE